MKQPPSTSETPGEAAARIFALNDRINQLLIEKLDSRAWSARLPAPRSLEVRTIAAIFTHMHNVRTKWIRLNAPHLEVPAQLGRARCTPQQARAALATSAAACVQMLAEALDGSGRIVSFLRDGWAQPLPPGREMLWYMLAHEAHHRGQVCMLAHQLGFKLPGKITSAMWNWEAMIRDHHGRMD
ncbi:damage-inducible protein DinB [Acidobacteria bacterium AB60]|nr:damage-inducible protein DinB [Acidobacteria bacterium AB60]